MASTYSHAVNDSKLDYLTFITIKQIFKSENNLPINDGAFI